MITNELGLWAFTERIGDSGSYSLSEGYISGFESNKLIYATAVNKAFRNATVVTYTLAQILANTFSGSEFNFSIGINPDLSTFITSFQSAMNSYITTKAGKINSAAEADHASSATSADSAGLANTFSTARTINLTGAISGSATSNGATGWTINTTISNGAVTNSKLANPSLIINAFSSTGTLSKSTTLTLGSNIRLNDLFGFASLSAIQGDVKYSSGGFYLSVPSSDYTEVKEDWSIIPNSCAAGNKFLSKAEFPYATTIGTSAFENCSNLSIFKGESTHLRIIGSCAFRNCSHLMELFGVNPIYIGSSAFQGCNLVGSFTFTRLSSVASSVFYNNSNITKLRFDKASYINEYAFYDCSRLSVLYLLSTQMCGLKNANAFSGTKIITDGVVIVPSNLVQSYKNAAEWSAVPDGNFFSYVEG